MQDGPADEAPAILSAPPRETWFGWRAGERAFLIYGLLKDQIGNGLERRMNCRTDSWQPQPSLDVTGSVPSPQASAYRLTLATTGVRSTPTASLVIGARAAVVGDDRTSQEVGKIAPAHRSDVRAVLKIFSHQSKRTFSAQSAQGGHTSLPTDVALRIIGHRDGPTMFDPNSLPPAENFAVSRIIFPDNWSREMLEKRLRHRAIWGSAIVSVSSKLQFSL
jgi:hypothetical protein